ncbi:MAG: Spy/CpxP family protein refolding chaperone [Gemmatimonadaceae bacterium]
MKLQYLSVAAAALMAAPILNAQATTAPTPPNAATRAGAASQMGPRRGRPNMMMKDLNLTADQQAKVNAIRTKYAAQMKSARASSKPDFDAMKAARTRNDTTAMRSLREKMRADMAPSMKLRQQQMAETRAVLTPDQQKKFDVQQDSMKARMGRRGMRGFRGMQPPNTKPSVPQQSGGSAI